MGRTKVTRTRVGLIVEGDAEFRSLGRLFSRLPDGGQVVSVLRSNLQPLSSYEIMAKAVQSRLATLAAENVDLAIVVFDREQREECPEILAQGLCAAIDKMCIPRAVPRIEVVLKDRCFENWLIGDIDTVVRTRKRFSVNESDQRTIRSGRADTLDAMALLKESAIGKSYDKVADAIQILERADPMALAVGSRSFRRLLRVIDHPVYTKQSRKPVRPSS